MKKLRYPLLLLLCAAIWGFAFTAQQVGMEHLTPMAFNWVRFWMGSLVLIPAILFMNRGGRRQKTSAAPWYRDRSKIRGVILCGVILGVATNIQQFGLLYTTVGKSSFLTALYILFVPILGIFLHKKAGLSIWISTGIALAGMYLLCMTDSFSLQKGDVLTLICALCFSFHILAIDKYVSEIEPLLLSCLQFFIAGTLSGIGALMFETISWQAFLDAWLPVCYAGVFSCGAGYTLQVIGQQQTPPALASIILSMESVFGVIGGWLILGQSLSPREIFGCLLMLAAILLAQSSEFKRVPEAS